MSDPRAFVADVASGLGVTEAARRQGITHQAMIDLVHRHNLWREFQLAKDARWVMELEKRGIECRNGCGLVIKWKRCPECGTFAVPNRRKKA